MLETATPLIYKAENKWANIKKNENSSDICIFVNQKLIDGFVLVIAQTILQFLLIYFCLPFNNENTLQKVIYIEMVLKYG